MAGKYKVVCVARGGKQELRWEVQNEKGVVESYEPFTDKQKAMDFANGLAVAHELYDPKLLDKILSGA